MTGAGPNISRVLSDLIPSTDATSGAVLIMEPDENGNATEAVLAEIPYSNYTGTTCTFDLTELNSVDAETESGVVVATLVPEDEVITIGGGGFGPLNN